MEIISEIMCKIISELALPGLYSLVLEPRFMGLHCQYFWVSQQGNPRNIVRKSHVDFYEGGVGGKIWSTPLVINSIQTLRLPWSLCMAICTRYSQATVIIFIHKCQVGVLLILNTPYSIARIKCLADIIQKPKLLITGSQWNVLFI